MGLCMIRWLLSNPLPRVTQSLAFPRTIFSIRPILRSAQQGACCNSSRSSIFRRISQTPRSRWSPKSTSVNAQCCTWKCREHDGDDHHGCWQQTPLSLSLSTLSDLFLQGCHSIGCSDMSILSRVPCLGSISFVAMIAHFAPSHFWNSINDRSSGWVLVNNGWVVPRLICPQWVTAPNKGGWCGRCGLSRHVKAKNSLFSTFASI